MFKSVFTISAGIVVAAVVISTLPALARLVGFTAGLLWFSGLWVVIPIAGGLAWYLQLRRRARLQSLNRQKAD